MQENTPVLTLMTDFGHGGIFAGVMKGVIAGIAPKALVIDLTHNIPPFDVVQAAFKLRQAYRYFPAETIHVVVVDPGVGSERKAVAMRSGGHMFVAPDNGVLCLIDEEAGHEELVEIAEKGFFLPNISASFHGRDIFAPAAAHLAAGIEMKAMGSPLESLCPLKILHPEVKNDQSLAGTVLWCDRFGNLITNVPACMIAESAAPRFHVGETVVEGLSRTYASVPEGELLAMIGSFGMLEFAVHLGNAAERLSAGPGTLVRITLG